MQNLKRASHHKDFNVCDAGPESKNKISDPNTINASMAECWNVEVDIQNSEANFRLKKIKEEYTAAQKMELNQLLLKATDFFKRHVDKEMKINSIPASTSLAIVLDENLDYREKSELRNSLINSVYSFEQGNFPVGSKQTYAKISADFNKHLKEIKTFYLYNEASPGNQYPGSAMQSEDEIQAAWMAYADQFIKFASKRYPQVPEYRWKIWLMKQRITQLIDYLEDIKDRLSEG